MEESKRINSVELANRAEQAKAKIKEGHDELSAVHKIVEGDLDALANESQDYLSRLEVDLSKANNVGNTTEASRIRADISVHKDAMSRYQTMARENVGRYVDMEKLEKEFDTFIFDMLVMWYSEESAKKTKISMEITDLSEIDYDSLSKPDAALYGKYTMNSETIKMNFEEKKPKIRVLDEELKQFADESISEIVSYVVKTYSQEYYIPGLEYEKYLLENPDKIPVEFKEGDNYYCVGSTIRCSYSSAEGAGIPAVYLKNGQPKPNGIWLGKKWQDKSHIVLIER